MAAADWKNKFAADFDVSETTELVQKTVQFVQNELQANDASHDWNHIERVWRLARRIASQEGVPPDSLEIIDLAALLHDVDDWKYQKETEAPKEKQAEKHLRSEGMDPERLARVMDIINGIGFKEELGNTNKLATIELACVQDADRLDAVGAIGIARCFTYGGFKKRPLYDSTVPPEGKLTQETYMNKQRVSPTINHFYEKLFRLQDMMKTESGRKLAHERHQFMEEFVSQFFMEISGRR